MTGTRARRRCEVTVLEGRSAAGLDGGLGDAQHDGHSFGSGPSGPGGGGGRWRGGATLRDAGGGVDGAAARRGPRAWAVGARGAARPGGGGVVRTHALLGYARQSASPGESTRHCSLALLCSCSPACRLCMGSARASRSGWSPDSEGKEFDRPGPRRAMRALPRGVRVRGRGVRETDVAAAAARMPCRVRKGGVECTCSC